ncbi:hypothetical protein M0R04_13860 [Candidatus Dojkabacteria bacterium]|jgi:hypothetical protein|nr:hypothetical protein [Candidatus Dojkabacteria bacterium]
MATGTFPTATMSSTTLASNIPLLWGEKINEFFKLKLMIADFFTDRSSELAGGGSALYTPNLTEFTAAAKANATAVTLNNATDTKVTLTVDQWYEVSFSIEDKEAAQVKHSYYLQERYAQGAGYTIAKKLEVALAELFDNFSTTVGASTTALADSEIRAAIAALENVGIDTTQDVAFFLHPNVFWKQVQNLDKFSLAVNSPVNDPTAKTPSATLYGIPVFVSANIQYISGTVGRTGALAHKDALHWATSPLGSGGSLSGGSMTGKYGVRVQSNYIPEYLATLTTADLLYGVVENRDNAGVAIWSQNT